MTAYSRDRSLCLGRGGSVDEALEKQNVAYNRDIK